MLKKYSKKMYDVIFLHFKHYKQLFSYKCAALNCDHATWREEVAQVERSTEVYRQLLRNQNPRL